MKMTKLDWALLVIALALAVWFGLALSAKGQNALGYAHLGYADLGANVAASSGFSDSFTEASDTDLTNHVTTVGGHAWKRWSTGQYLVQNNVITNTTLGGQCGAYYVDYAMPSADYTASIDIVNPGDISNREIDLGIRYDGSAVTAQDGYFVAWFSETGYTRLYKVVNGTATELALFDTEILAPTNLWIQVSGSTVTAKVDTRGAATLTGATDAGITANGYVAIGSGWRNCSRDSISSTVDNLTVTVP